MRYQVVVALLGLLLHTQLATAQYESGIRSRFGGTVPRSTFYAPNTLTMNYKGLVGQGLPGRGVAGLPGDFAQPLIWRLPVSEPRVEPIAILKPVPVEAPATVIVEFPAPATVEVNGRVLPGRQLQIELTSPVLQLGDMHAFDIRATWEAGGRTLASRRVLEVEAGKRVRLVVLAGNPVMKR